jgi:hypothetical protein
LLGNYASPQEIGWNETDAESGDVPAGRLNPCILA